MRSVKSIAKVTGAMEAVAVAKNHRLRSRAEESGPFARASWRILTHLAAATNPEIRNSPLFSGYDALERLGVLLIAGDRGMAGGYNRKVVQEAVEHIETHDDPVSLLVIGKEGRDMISAEGYDLEAYFPLTDQDTEPEDVTEVTRALMGGYREARFQRAIMVYTPFVPGKEPTPRTRQLFPIRPTEELPPRHYIFEPHAEEVLSSLLPQALRFQVYEAFLTSLTAEHASRAVAMRKATQNGNELIERLTLDYNKARQASITEDLMDIVGGASALYKE
jgi:F-type H+-transporting ATPase subunit gamma